MAEFNIFVGVFRSYPILGGFAVLAAAFSAAYIFRMFALVFFGEFNPRWSALKDLQKKEVFGGLVLAGSILFMGVFPKPFTDRIGPTVARLPGVEDPTQGPEQQASRSLDERRLLPQPLPPRRALEVRRQPVEGRA